MTGRLTNSCRTLICAAAILLTSHVANAQEKGQVGLTMTYPARAGVLWHVTDRISILPDIAIQRDVSTSVFTLSVGNIFGPRAGTTTRTTNTFWRTSPGVNLLVDVGRWDDVTTYVTAGWSYERIHQRTIRTTENDDGVISVPAPGTQTDTDVSHGYGARGAFGVRYVPHRHFGAFGEVGVEYSKTKSGSETVASSLGNSGVAGVIFYF